MRGGSWSGGPFNRRFAVIGHAVAKVHIDQHLIGQIHLLGQLFEVFNGVVFQADSNLSLEHLGVWILCAMTEVVGFSHSYLDLPYSSVFARENGLCFPKRDAMLSLIVSVLLWIPFK
jgi:hypothetical protein